MRGTSEFPRPLSPPSYEPNKQMSTARRKKNSRVIKEPFLEDRSSHVPNGVVIWALSQQGRCDLECLVISFVRLDLMISRRDDEIVRGQVSTQAEEIVFGAGCLLFDLQSL